jgi:rod shape determining protein RodA
LDQRIEWYSPKSLIVPFVLALVPIGLIIIEPDLSSSLVFFPMALVMFYMAGARALHLSAICLVGGIAAGVPLLSTYMEQLGDALDNHPVLLFLARAFKGGWPSVWLFAGVCLTLVGLWWFLRKLRIYIPTLYLWVTLFLLMLGTMGAVGTQRVIKDYQRKRLVAFVNPELDPLGGGYNVRQSQIAIGSGRMIGKGYGLGTQSRLGFLPSRHTDFIFSVIGEELGFFRSIIVLFFYFLIIWRGFEISLVSRDRYGGLIAAGFASMFAFYALLNLGMTMGMAPVAGVPLPMVSYGGSSVMSSMMAVGILLSIHWRRYLL